MSAINQTPSDAARPMLLDDVMPVFDATRREHRVVDGPPSATYATLLEIDFVEVWKDSPAIRALFAARGAAEEIVSRVRGQDPPSPPEPTTMRIADLTSHGEYVRLGADPPHEFAFGMIGRFWAGETSWRPIDASQFATFSEPGLAKIGCNFSLRAYGASRTLVSYEARTKATDERSRRQFLRYWKAVSPGAGVVMRGMLAMIDAKSHA